MPAYGARDLEIEKQCASSWTGVENGNKEGFGKPSREDLSSTLRTCCSLCTHVAYFTILGMGWLDINTDAQVMHVDEYDTIICLGRHVAGAIPFEGITGRNFLQ